VHWRVVFKVLTLAIIVLVTVTPRPATATPKRTATVVGPISQLSDTFDSDTSSASIWAIGNLGTPFGPAAPSVLVAETNHQLAITPATNIDANTYSGYVSNNAYSLTGGAVFVQVLGTASGESGDTQFTIGTDQNHFAQILVQNGLLYTQVYDGTFHVVGDAAGVPYSPAVHAWWRFRESGGTLYFESSPDVSNWTALAGIPAPFATGAVYVNMSAGTWGSEPGESTAIFANLNNATATAASPSPSTADNLTIAAASSSTPSAPSISVTHVDTMVTGSGYNNYGTYGSHNQKVVANGHGIFITYLHSDDTSFGTDNVVWRLARSTDGGKTFTTIYQGNGLNTKCPPIETDANDNVYAFAPNLTGGSWSGSDTDVYRFSPSNDYGAPTISTSIATSAGKMTTAFDAGRQLIYYATWANGGESDLYAVKLDGTIAWSKQIYTYDNTYFAHYPQLRVAPDGTLYFAWTVTDLTARGQDYYDARFIYSKDGGTTWMGKNGAIGALPINPGPSGPSWEVVDSSDVAGVGSTQVNWLANMAFNGDRLHFVYDKDFGQKEVYKRFDPATGSFDAEMTPRIGGETISIMAAHGFFAQDSTSAGRLFYAGDGPGGTVGIVYSDDHGSTWHDYGRSPQITTAAENAITYLGGARELMPDGSVVGSFTLTSGPGQPADVYFFRAHP
jgi:hypothetical protein